MKIAVIGAKGQLAKALQQLREVKAFSKEEINLLDPSPLNHIDFDVLINAGAYNWTEKAEEEPDMAYCVNGYSVGELVKIAKKKNAIFMHVSTDFVFSGFKGSSYNESDRVAPLSVYGASKLLGEQMALEYSKSYVFRTASVFSKDGANFPSAILKRAKEGKELRVIEDIRMSPTYAGCLAEWMYRALDLEIPFGLYHAVNKGDASWYQFACSLLKKGQFQNSISPCSMKEYPSKINRPQNSVLDISKLENAIGPMMSMEDAIDQYFGESNG